MPKRAAASAGVDAHTAGDAKRYKSALSEAAEKSGNAELSRLAGELPRQIAAMKQCVVARPGPKSLS